MQKTLGIPLKRINSLGHSMALPLDVLEKSVNRNLILLLKDGRTITGRLLDLCGGRNWAGSCCFC